MNEWKRASKVLKPEFLGRYRQIVESFYADIVTLNSNNYLIEKIETFRHDLFTDTNMHFWHLTHGAMIERNISIIFRIGLDKGSRTITLPKLANEVSAKIEDGAEKAEFEARLAKVDFESRIESYRSPLEDVRHRRVAHFNKLLASDLSKVHTLQWNEAVENIVPATALLNELFDVICIGHGSGKTFIDYAPNITPGAGSDGRSDIETLLDLVAKSSALLNMREEQPGFWPMYRTNLSPADLKVLNRYRTKFGLPKVE